MDFIWKEKIKKIKGNVKEDYWNRNVWFSRNGGWMNENEVLYVLEMYF